MAAPHPCSGTSASSRLASTPGPVLATAGQGTRKAQGYTLDALVGHDESQSLDQAGGSKESFPEEMTPAQKRKKWQPGPRVQWVGKWQEGESVMVLRNLARRGGEKEGSSWRETAGSGGLFLTGDPKCPQELTGK